MTKCRQTRDHLKILYETSLFQLISRAHSEHISHHTPGEVELCTLISFKTGGCEEDCQYCAQSSRYKTFVQPQKYMSVEEALDIAQKAQAQGAKRICIGTATRQTKDGRLFDEILAAVTAIRSLGLEVCCCLGMLEEKHARQLKEAGLYAYNHNIDTSERFYPSIVSTRNYQDRLATLKIASEAGLSVCSGVILGLGETEEDRIDALHTLTLLDPKPASIPVNVLVPIKGTPLEQPPALSFWDILRFIATTRISIPTATIRLSAGRIGMLPTEQALAFFAGANSIHCGNKPLTTPNNSSDEDELLFQALGLTKKQI